MCKYMNMENFEQGEFVFNFGDLGSKFYIVLSGSIYVRIPVDIEIELKHKEYEDFLMKN